MTEPSVAKSNSKTKQVNVGSDTPTVGIFRCREKRSEEGFLKSRQSVVCVISPNPQELPYNAEHNILATSA